MPPRPALERPSLERGGFSFKGDASVLTWLNLVCLDAPLVAISWQWLFARSFGIPIVRGGTTALFLTAWLIYLVDRFGDSLTICSAVPASLRQRFCLQHRRVWIGAIALISAVDLLVICLRLDSRTIVAGAVVGAIALCYLVANRRWPFFWRLVPLKETSIGFLFAAGTMVGLASGLTVDVIPAWFLFGVLCSANCIGIAIWERALDEAQQRISIATAFPGIGRHFTWMGLLLAVVCLVFGFANAQARSVCLCLAVSAILLVGLHLFRDHIAPDIRTALADLVLLTPMVLLVTAVF